MGRVKRAVRGRLGWARVMEARNKLMLAHTAPPLRRFETREVRRLSATAPGAPPSALVATIIPTYCRPEGLRRAVASALAQTVTDQVVMVIDDGGGLPELPGDPRLVVVSLSRNVGVVGVVRNIGIRLTRSRFVAFLDDDNTWRPDHLEVAVGRLRVETRLHGVYTALRRVTADGQQRDVLSVPFDRRGAADRCFLDTNAFVGRRSPALRFSRLRRTPEVMPREDWEMIFRYSRGRHIEHIPAPTVEYLVNPDSYWTAWQST
jgi:glycosyltransferase involved in cell wall biosynthesis